MASLKGSLVFPEVYTLRTTGLELGPKKNFFKEDYFIIDIS